MRVAQGTVAVLACWALGGLLAACGSYTKADFVARADAICASTLRATRAIVTPGLGSGGAGAGAGSAASDELRALAGYLAKAAPLVRSEARQLGALRRPTSGDARERALLGRYLAALNRAAGDYAALATAARRGDAAGVASAESALRANPAAALAARYGLHSCGGAGATVS